MTVFRKVLEIFNFAINFITIEEQNNIVSESRNRWIVRVVLVLAAVAFVGVSLLPIIGSLNETKIPPQNQATGIIIYLHLNKSQNWKIKFGVMN